jgi:PTH1 family peptidyl-tRNA hydrolase
LPSSFGADLQSAKDLQASLVVTTWVKAKLSMKLIVGLGNPGRKYAETRHNVGFVVAAKIMPKIGAMSVREKFNGELAEGAVDGQKVAVLCPMTFMNASGSSVRKAIDFYKIEPASDDLLVICDDLNLPCGRLRIRRGGSAGGQKGLADVIRMLATDQVPRLRIGIDRPPAQMEVVDYVLGKIEPDNRELIEQVCDTAANAAFDWIRGGTAQCMNRYNADPKRQD